MSTDRGSESVSIVAEFSLRGTLQHAACWLGLLLGITLSGATCLADVDVVTAHNDIARTGQNTSESVLTPANVNSQQFGKLFSHTVIGSIDAQPLYVSQVTIPNKGSHHVVYAATSAGYIYAFDANSNGGMNANPLWSVALKSIAPAGTTLTNRYGVIGTPVIQESTNTLFVVSSDQSGSSSLFRLHALDLGTGAEKLGGPILIQGSVPGNGNGSSNGVLSFDPSIHFQRPGLLLLNDVVYVGFASIGDNGAWHGWIFSYSTATLKRIDIFCTSAYGSGSGIWMSGAGLAAEVTNASQPYGRMFPATGNGNYAADTPYTNTMSYGMSVLNLDLTNGVMTIKDAFTPFNESTLDGRDGDLGAGGAVLLPTQTLASGKVLEPLVQIGKSGMIYILNRNDLGGFHSGEDAVVQEVQTPQVGANNWGLGVWGSPAYWNNNIYFGGIQYTPQGTARPGSSMTAYSFKDGRLSTSPTSSTQDTFAYPGPSPSISSNGSGQGIVWALKTDGYTTNSDETLFAYSATNLGDTLYSSDTESSRDDPGGAVKYNVPTVANGKVYVGAVGKLSVYGLLAAAHVAPSPTFKPGSGAFSGPVNVAISDANSSAQIYYTTDGSIPTVASLLYSGPIVVSSSETIRAIASANSYLQSPPSSATYDLTDSTPNPTFSLAAGSYPGARTLSLADQAKTAKIYYTWDGSTPTSASDLYTGPLSIPVSETINAIAITPGLKQSSVVGETFTITPPYLFDFSQGFSDATSVIQFNGSTALDDFRLQLTGGYNQAGSAFYKTPVSIQAFTTEFIFQLSNPVADGMTFTIQGNSPTALGADGGNLGYGGIGKSVAIKFDLYNSQGEGPNSSGLYLNGALPTIPAIDLTASGINLHSGDYMDTTVTYDGISLVITVTDEITLASWSHLWTVDIPKIVGSSTAYVGFTGGTGGGGDASQKLTSWTYLAGQPISPNYPAGFDGVGLTFNGAHTFGTWLRLTDGGSNEARSVFFSKPVSIQAFTTDFDFKLLKATADGFTFVIQNSGPKAVGSGGGGLGYQGLPSSVAIKFDIYNGQGEGNNSTGVFVDGASPTVPSINLTPSKVILASGDVFHAHIVYQGTTLTWTLTDKSLPSHPSATNSANVNIPNDVGGNAAYVGFTAGTGGASAIQYITNWSFSQ